MTDETAHRSVDAVWRLESARVIAGLVRMVRDVALAEDLAQDALEAALQQWPETGVPANPGAWLMAVAKRRAVDHFRRAERLERKHALLAHAAVAGPSAAALDAVVEDDIEDDLLRLMFICCHPVLSTEARVALTLRLLGGLTTKEIARSFLTSEATVAQRIVRAKRTLGEARVPFEVPSWAERTQRLSSVLEVLYLVFNEGYSATAGGDWMRPALCEEALRLGRVLAGLTPDEPEVHGLVALTQNQARWDQLLVRRGLAALERAESLPGSPGRYVLQAQIAACHARAVTASATDWARVAELYTALGVQEPSPVVQLNRAVALAMAHGPHAGLVLVDQLRTEPSLQGYHLLPSVRGDLLARLGRAEEARAEFRRAAALTQNERERALLLRRAEAAVSP